MNEKQKHFLGRLEELVADVRSGKVTLTDWCLTESTSWKGSLIEYDGEFTYTVVKRSSE